MPPIRLLLAGILLLAHSLANATAAEWIDAALSRGLDRDRTWLRLLHIPAASQRSEVRSPDFFIATDGATSARAELVATIEGLFAPTGVDADQHVRCRFPARSLWLSSKLRLSAPPGPAQCPAYEAWARPATLSSINLLMVSGYLGNPASSFGHSLLRLNHGDGGPPSRLLDLSFNFGALVPENEPTLTYIVKGLFGGYQAGFSDKLYYSHDQVYTHAEMRDIWNYELLLQPPQQALLVAHLWEITGRKFTYFFLSRNCAFRLAQLVALATEADHDPPARLWYLPVELFFALERSAGPSLVANVEHIPSAERWLYAHRRRLDGRERSSVAEVLEGRSGLEPALSPHPPERHAALLETLLAELDYRDAARKQPSGDTSALRDAVLTARLRRPRGTGSPLSVERLPPPTAEEAPQRWRIGVENRDGAAGLDLRWSPYLQDGVLGAEAGTRTLIVLDLRLSGALEQPLRLDRLDLLRIRRRALLDASGSPWGGEAWALRLGLERDALGRDGALVEGGLGRAFQPASGMLIDLMLDARLATAAQASWLMPNLGLAHHRGRFGARLGVGYRVADRDLAPWQAEWQGRWRLDSNWSLELEGQYRAEDRRVSLGVNRYW